MRAKLTKDFFFESGQTLPNVPPGHKCARFHGHSFKAEISVEGEVDPKMGWVMDHSCISDAMKPVLEEIDHMYLNEIPGLSNPTIENLAAWIWKKLEPELPGLAEIVIHETPVARCSYSGR